MSLQEFRIFEMRYRMRMVCRGAGATRNLRSPVNPMSHISPIGSLFKEITDE
jgi:hypothetical protein